MAYQQRDEVKFIMGIQNPAVLAGYIKALENRTEWGELDRDETIAFAVQRLRVLERAH